MRTNESDFPGKAPDAGQAGKEQQQDNWRLSVQNQSPLEGRHHLNDGERSGKEKDHQKQPRDEAAILSRTHSRELSFEGGAAK